MVRLTRLKTLRQRKALTQQELADKAGINRVTLARIETGAEPYPATTRRLAQALGVEPEALMDPDP
jgi:transcriptional regulator with XRE-family HTH domain